MQTHKHNNKHNKYLKQRLLGLLLVLLSVVYNLETKEVIGTVLFISLGLNLLLSRKYCLTDTY
jgi:hypothetical protein